MDDDIIEEFEARIAALEAQRDASETAPVFIPVAPFEAWAYVPSSGVCPVSVVAMVRTADGGDILRWAVQFEEEGAIQAEIVDEVRREKFEYSEPE